MWHGVFPYLPSPTLPGGDLDAPSLNTIVNKCIDAGVHGLTPLGSSGELPYFSEKHRTEIVSTTIAAADGRVPVVAGVGGFSSENVATEAAAMESLGADGVLLVILSYFPLGTTEILRFIEKVTQRIGIPIVLYNHPKLSHTVMTTEVVSRAFNDLGIQYIKDASGDITNIERWADATSNGIRFFSATAISPTAAMLLGAVGWMSGPASAFPAESVAIYERAARGDYEEALAIERKLNKSLEVFRTLGPSRGIRQLFRSQGVEIGDSPSPIGEA